MPGGYLGQVLLVNLLDGKIDIDVPGEKEYREFIGGYGLGAKLLYDCQKLGEDPLGPGNTLGFFTGPLTGTPAVFGCRFVAVAKSPLTGGWGDANCGGHFGPHLKFAGYDGILISGVAGQPSYLYVEDGKAELLDASLLWGQDTFATQDWLEAKHGRDAKVISIGPSGEKKSLISCIITDRGSAAGRSGLGAVMGSKLLKAVVVKGKGKIPVADPEALGHLRREHMADISKSMLEELRLYGTTSHAAASVHSGDSPVKNWGGVGVVDLPDVSGLEKERVAERVQARTGCWHCPVACRGILREGPAIYRYPPGTRRPEYETTAAFGAMCANNNMDAIILANHICNSSGLDTISAGTAIAFAMECYENGILNRVDTDSIDLRWGNAAGMVLLLEKMANREGLGAVLADGVRAAAVKIGRGAERFAVHAGGQEPGLHDPKFDFPAFAGKPTAARFLMDATPGRHTSGFGPSQFQAYVVNAEGLCLHSDLATKDPRKYIAGYLKAVTGWDRSMDELLVAGERIAVMRHLFTLREGDNPLHRQMHDRIIGTPPHTTGPLAGVTCDLEGQIRENLAALNWNSETTMPSQSRLRELGIEI